MADNYDERSEPFKLQAQHVFVANSSESDEPSTNMDNYTSVTNNKMLYYTADVAVEEKPEFFIISSIESNVKTQTQIKPKKPSERDKLLSKTKVQRRELSLEEMLLWMLKLHSIKSLVIQCSTPKVKN